MSIQTTPQSTTEQVEALAGRIFMAGLEAVELYTVHLGIQLGLYRALDEGGAQTAAELAARTDLERRYVREWLQSQAISGFVSIDGSDVDEDRFALAPGVRETLIDEISPSFVGAIPAMLPAVGGVIPDLVASFRSGERVAYNKYPQAVSVQEAMNRPAYENSLVAEWLPQIPEVLARLKDESEPARVADFCCGPGWSSIVLAEAFPHITVEGLDNDQESIGRAQRNSAARGVSDRVRFENVDVTAADPDPQPRYDVAFVFEAIHDLPHPVHALAHCRRTLKPGAPLIVMDERVGEHLTAPSDEVERFMAACSVVWCTPQGHGPGSEVVGAVMRPNKLEDLAHHAGFTTVEILPIEHPFWRFYQLHS
jgi:2-polyprenyl-3-methyl-5-hydroxy-6-metoxy-1,4-benzoquinol methylase